MPEPKTEPRVIIKGASLYADDWALARKVAEEVGSRSASAGLRAIIAEYRRLKEQPEPARSQGGGLQGG